jgi:hypothetical protein
MHTEKITTWSVLEDVKEQHNSDWWAQSRSLLRSLARSFALSCNSFGRAQCEVSRRWFVSTFRSQRRRVEPSTEVFDDQPSLPSPRQSHISTPCFLGRVQKNESLNMAWSSAPLHRCRLWVAEAKIASIMISFCDGASLLLRQHQTDGAPRTWASQITFISPCKSTAQSASGSDPDPVGLKTLFL